MTFKNILTIVTGGLLILLLGIGLGMHLYAKSIEQETEQMARCQDESDLCESRSDASCKEAAPAMADKALPVIMRCIPGADMFAPR